MKVTVERRFFKNDGEWHYMLSQLGIKIDGDAAGYESTDYDSVEFDADNIKPCS